MKHTLFLQRLSAEAGSRFLKSERRGVLQVGEMLKLKKWAMAMKSLRLNELQIAGARKPISRANIERDPKGFRRQGAPA